MPKRSNNDSNRSKKSQLKGMKSHLPTKNCATCGRPFQYRKKWKNIWSEVKYCGERCRRNKSKAL